METTLPPHWLQKLLPALPESARQDFAQAMEGLRRNPHRVREIHDRFYRLHLESWAGLVGARPEISAPFHAEAADHRFDDPAWKQIPWFRHLQRSYLINAHWARELIDAAGLPNARHRRMHFIMRQWLDACAPTNFLATNPEAARLALQTAGRSVLQGIERLERDAARGRIEMTDEQAFEVGRSLAVTPGAVVYQNPLAQLIQYQPRSTHVHAHPLFIVPPFINKYYVLDLRPENSFVRYALEQGFQVFIVSWRNVHAELGSATWSDYIDQGVLHPLRAVKDICAAEKINALGFCVGGTLLATALAVAAEREHVASLTLLATLLDFADPGEISVYIDQAFVQRCESQFAQDGVMPGSTLSSAFASLRANELVWYFVVNNYLKGQAPRAFDLLYWNADNANVPGKLYAWYLRHAYLENNLREPGKLQLKGQPLDFGDVALPTMIVAAREDHIVPWRSAYASTALLAGRIEFVLAASGHIAGIV